jgi:glycosyltransferase involved in cell wall biosynthesis
MLAVHSTAGTWSEGVTGYIALTEFSRRKFVAAGLPSEKIHVKPNFVTPDPGPNEEFGDFAVYVGRLSPEKGVRTLLHAWRQLRTSIPLQIIGDGPLRRELARMVTECNLSNVVFTGRLSSDETRSRIRGARLLVLPSECYENFPMAVVEAFSCGTPVVCSRHGAMQEIVNDHRTGLHFSPGKPDELARALEWAWSNPQQIRDMGVTARRDYEQKYTAEQNYRALMAIYQQVLGLPIGECRLKTPENPSPIITRQCATGSTRIPNPQ